MDRGELTSYWVRAIADFTYTPADAKRYALRVSSGTSGKGPLIALTRLMPEALSDWFAGEGRVVLCYGSRALRLFNTLGSSEAGLSVFALDSADLVPERLALIAQFKPTRFHGHISFVLKVASQLPPEVRAGVREVKLGGELVTGSIERALRELFPNAEWSSQYSASEVGGITRASCGHLPWNHYHPLAAVDIAIADADEDGVGEIVISKMVGSHKVEGYRPGDLGRLYDTECPCGHTRVLELFGRAGFDYLKLAGGTLRIEEFDRVLEPYRSVVADYRVEAQTLVEGGNPKGKVRVRLYAPVLPTEELRSRIAESLMSVQATPTRTLRDLSAAGLFAPLEVEFTSQPLEQGYKSVRMRYVA